MSVYCLAGPTACGKTAVAHEIARRRGMRVLSADSMLVYRGMDIGTAKPPKAERAAYRYRGVDLVSPAESYSAGTYLHEANDALKEAERAGEDVLVVGGTGLYFELLLKGIDGGADPVPPELRAKWGKVYESEGLAGLHAAAESRAPGVLSRLDDPRNPRRVLRALERLDMGLDPAPRRDGTEPPLRIPVLDIPQPVLAGRISARIDAMFADGLVDEVRGLLADYPLWSDTASAAIGYAETRALISGELDLPAAKERIAARTRQLAKRQRTWFRNRMAPRWIPGPSSADDVSRAADEVLAAWNEEIG